MLAGRVNSVLSAEISWDLMRQKNHVRRWMSRRTRKNLITEENSVRPAVLLFSSDHGFNHASLHLQLSWALCAQKRNEYSFIYLIYFNKLGSTLKWLYWYRIVNNVNALQTGSINQRAGFVMEHRSWCFSRANMMLLLSFYSQITCTNQFHLFDQKADQKSKLLYNSLVYIGKSIYILLVHQFIWQ